MVGPLRIRGDCDDDADDAEEHVHKRPPGEIGEAVVVVAAGAHVGGRYYRADEGDDPGELSVTLAVERGRSRRMGATDDAYRHRREGERVSDDAAGAEGGAAATSVSVFHFAQRRGAKGAVRGHRARRAVAEVLLEVLRRGQRRGQIRATRG